MRGNEDPVNSVAFSPDGLRVVSAGDDGTARIWRVGTGAPVQVLRGHADYVNEAAFSPDGRTVVTASSDQSARIWNLRTGRTVLTLHGHRDFMTGASFSPDGRQVVTSGLDQTARVWEVSSGRPVVVLRGHSGPVLKAVFSPKGDQVLTASLDHTARLWKIPDPPVTLRHPARVNSAAYSPDGKSIVTAGHDGTARVWDASSSRQTAVLRTAAGPHVRRSLQRRRQAGTDGGRRWVRPSLEHRHEERREEFKVTPYPLVSADFSPEGSSAVIAGFDRAGHIYNARTGERTADLTAFADNVRRAVFSDDGKSVVAASDDGTARVFDAATGDQTAVLREIDGSARADPAVGCRLQPGWQTRDHGGLRGQGKGLGHRAQAHCGRSAGPSGQGPQRSVQPRRQADRDGERGRQRVPVGPGDDTQDRAARAENGAVRRAAFSPDGKFIVTASPGKKTARIVPCEVCAPIDDLLGQCRAG